jgi:hypothetical protein
VWHGARAGGWRSDHFACTVLRCAFARRRLDFD